MKSVKFRCLAGFIKKLSIHALLLFLPAGTLIFWQAWIFLLIFYIPSALFIIYFLKTDPALIERRLKIGFFAEKRGKQKLIMALLAAFSVLFLVIPGCDHRFQWSRVPRFLVIAADFAILVGLWIFFRVFKENSFASATVEIANQQTVISTGPYSAVRHPMYSGLLLIDFFTSLALGSWWGLPLFPGIVFVIILRIIDEEKLLRQSLPGYEEYCHRVQYRLIPKLW